MNMRITEQEKKDILSKYQDDTSDTLLTHLKRHYPAIEITYSWSNRPLKWIKVDDRMRPLEHNKKSLVGEISNLLEDEWSQLSTQMIRRTVKKYLDGIMAS
jgi:hypothetical protein